MGNVISSVASSSSAMLPAGLSYLFEKTRYIFELEDKVEALQSAIQRLVARRDDLARDIEVAARQGLHQLDEVGVWLLNVGNVESSVRSLLDARTVEFERLYMHGYCSSDFISTYCYGKDVFEKLETVEDLLSSGRLIVEVARRGPPPAVEKRPIHPTVGLESMLEATWKRLMQDEVGILGLYGMGGVGKTTLLEEINNKFLEERNEFDVVISVVVSQDLQIGRIQNEIGRRLGLDNMEWEIKKSKDEKAYGIYGVLSRKRFVLSLDDIWKEVNLKEIGIPLPNKLNRSKVIFTTRSTKFGGHMVADFEMEVKCLEPESAWRLFHQKVRASTLESDPQIPELARIVCGKCKGLPLSLKVIGQTMACKTTVREWQHAIDVLDSYAADFPEVEEAIFKVLKFSYDDLKDKIVQQCFLYCALLPEDHKIDRKMLVDYWICEGIINEGGNREKTMNKGHDIIGILVNACLLINLEFGVKVAMHDVVRQMAHWIASDFGKEKENIVVKTGAALDHMPEIDDWNVVRRMSLGNNEIQNISITEECGKLKTLFLQQNKLENIAGESFLSMPNLVVLDLSWNSYLKKLPEEVSALLALQYLGLAGTSLKELPVGLRKLVGLRHLDLDLMSHLQSISVITSLVCLETLKVYDSTAFTLEMTSEIELLKNLKFLSVTIKDISALERLLSVPRLAKCIQGLFLKGCKAINGIGLAENLYTLAVDGCYISDITVAWRYSRSVRPTVVCFKNLNYVSVSYVNGLEDLTWLLFAPSLTTLHVKGPSHDMQEIISRDKAARIMNEQPHVIPFGKLNMISLYSLVELTSVYWEPLPFPFLMEIVVIQCPKLKKLPFNAESCKDNLIRIVVDKEEQFGAFEWEDQATKDRFSPMRVVRP